MAPEIAAGDQQMRSTFLGLLVTAALVFSPAVAQASTLSWSFTNGDLITGSGIFEAVQDVGNPNPDVYTITAVSGTILGQTIVGLSPYGTADNLLYWNAGAPASFDPANPYYHADYFGIGFLLSNGDNYDLYEEAGIQPFGWTCGDASVPYCLLGPNTDASYNGFGDQVAQLTDFTVAAVPLPASLPFLAVGLGGLGFLGWRKKHSSNLVAAA